MKLLARLSINQRIASLAGFLLALLLVLTCVSGLSTNSLTGDVDRSNQHETRASMMLATADRDFYQAQIAATIYVLVAQSGNQAAADEQWADVEKNAGQVGEGFEQFAAAAIGVDGVTEESLEAFRADFKIWNDNTAAFKAAVDGNPASLAVVGQQQSDNFGTARDHLDKFSDIFNEDLLESTSGDIQDKGDRAFLIAILGGIAALLIGAPFAYAVARSVNSSVASSAHRLAGNAEELAALSTQLGASAASTVEQANSVFDQSSVVTDNVQAVAAAIEEMEASIQEISTNASEANRVASEGVSIAAQTNVQVERLGESSNEIGKVLEVINAIAEQTNLLALNATIEAARAGEAGKGFAVVANEVKDLAKGTAKATEDIAERITAIQTETTNAAVSINSIASVIDQVNGLQASIAGAVEEQTATVGEIARNVSTAASSASAITGRVRSVADMAEQSLTAADRSQEAATELRSVASELSSSKSPKGKTPQPPAPREEVSASRRFGIRPAEERTSEHV